MLAPETLKPNPAGTPSAGYKRDVILILAEANFVVECLAEVLRRHLPQYDVVVAEELEASLGENNPRVRLLLVYHHDAAEMTRFLSIGKTSCTCTSIGVLINAAHDLDAVATLLAKDQQINGILSMDMRLDVVLAGVGLLLKGGEHFPSAILRRMNPSHSAPVAPERIVVGEAHSDIVVLPEKQRSSLTAREAEILDLLHRGTQNKIIAHRLTLSENTIKAHIRSIYKKLGVRNRTQAALQHR